MDESQKISSNLWYLRRLIELKGAQTALMQTMIEIAKHASGDEVKRLIAKYPKLCAEHTREELNALGNSNPSLASELEAFGESDVQATPKA